MISPAKAVSTAVNQATFPRSALSEQASLWSKVEGKDTNATESGKWLNSEATIADIWKGTPGLKEGTGIMRETIPEKGTKEATGTGMTLMSVSITGGIAGNGKTQGIATTEGADILDLPQGLTVTGSGVDTGAALPMRNTVVTGNTGRTIGGATAPLATLSLVSVPGTDHTTHIGGFGGCSVVSKLA